MTSSELGQLAYLTAAGGFLSGGAFLYLVDKLLPHLHMGLDTNEAEGIKTNWQRSVLLVLAITLHNIPEGLAVGVAFGVVTSGMGTTASLAVVLAIAIAYVVVGLVLAVAGGTLIDKLGMEKYVVKFVNPGTTVDIELPNLTRKDRIIYAREQVMSTIKKVILYILIGVGIGALIHNWVPESFIQTVLGESNPFSVLIATVVGIPMYADILGTIPIAEALYAKGVGVGTILSFMMGVTALSLPSMIMLKRVVKNKLLAVFIGVVAVGILITGYVFNALSFLI